MSLRNNIFKLISPALFLLSTILSFPQSYERELNMIPVSDDEGLINNTFSGGHNNLEYQFIDIDGDGDLDIFYLDSDQTFGWFENIGSKFNADFKYSLTLPEGLNFSNWFYFVDIDDDGDLDYFTSNDDQISFYKNDGNVTLPYFILAQDTVRDNEGQPIYSEFSSNPIFVDIDGDGDDDFISGNSAGTLIYYENIGTPQNFNLKFITSVWQDIVIVGGGANPLHGASSIDFVDIDDDNDLDLFWGDLFSKSLYVIENQGTLSNPDMHRVSNIYPINSDSIYTFGFNMPRFADIDSDSDYDLFVSVLFYVTDVPQSLMFYENTGSPQLDNYIFRTNDFLKTLDIGNNSAPVFVDIDNDGDLDLFIGSLNNTLGSISFLENTGSETNPSFYFADSTFFNITSDLSVSPAFGDIDGDEDYDLIVGKLNGTLDVFINTGSNNSPQYSSSFLLIDNLTDTIDVVSRSVPSLFDIDNDLDLDLIIGSLNGKFYFYKNTGNSNVYEYTNDALYFENLDVGSSSSPFIIDYNKDGAYDLFSGNSDGDFFYFRNDGTNLSPLWNEITQNLILEDFGAYSQPFFVDIDNDTDMDLILGNVKGGLYLYTNYEISGIDEGKITPVNNFEISAFPNPFNPETKVRLELSIGQDLKINVFNLLGEKVKTIFDGYIKAGTSTFNWDAKSNSGLTLPAGIYFILVSSKEAQKVIKVAFLK